MPRTLITGAGGFTGRYLAPLLEAEGHEVHGMVHAIPATGVAGTHRLFEADLADLAAVTSVIDEVQPHHVVHLAAIAYAAHSDIEQMYRSNVVGTRQLLQALSQNPQNLQSIVLASSANVYGNAHEGKLDESTPATPANDYGVSKLAAEQLAAIYSPQLPIIVVRPFNYTGVGQGTDFLLPKLVAHARHRSPVIELGNLEVERDFSDVRTIADAYLRLLTAPAAVGQVFNVCSGRAVALADVVQIVSRLSGHHFDIEINPAFVRTNEVRTLWGSAEKVEGVIGRLKSIPLEETLRWMLES